jgi:hypothetical protein
MINNNKRKLDNISLDSDEKIKKIIKAYLGPKIDEVDLDNDEEISLVLDEIERGSKPDSYDLSSIVSNKERRRIAKEKLIELSESKETFDGKPMIVGKDNDGYDSDMSDITQGGKGKKNKKKTLKKKKKTLKKRTRKHKKKSSKNTRKRR